MCSSTNDQYVVFADIINKITRTGGKVITDFVVLSKMKFFKNETFYIFILPSVNQVLQKNFI